MNNKDWLSQIKVLTESKHFNLVEIDFGSDDDDIDEIFFHEEFNGHIYDLQNKDITFENFKDFFEENFDLDNNDFYFWYLHIETNDRFEVDNYKQYIEFHEYVNGKVVSPLSLRTKSFLPVVELEKDKLMKLLKLK